MNYFISTVFKTIRRTIFKRNLQKHRTKLRYFYIYSIAVRKCAQKLFIRVVKYDFYVSFTEKTYFGIELYGIYNRLPGAVAHNDKPLFRAAARHAVKAEKRACVKRIHKNFTIFTLKVKYSRKLCVFAVTHKPRIAVNRG